MILIVGQKTRRFEKGEVEHFCVVCRAVTPGAHTEVRRYTHAYYVTIGAGKCVGNEVVCTSCGVRVMDLPRGSAEINERVALEERMLDGRLRAGERERLLLEPFRTFAPHQAALAARSGYQSVSSLIALAGIIATFVAMGLVGMLIVNPTVLHPLFWVLAVFATAMAVWMFAWAMKRQRSGKGSRRTALQELFPVLALSLAPLNPREEEIRWVFDTLMKERNGIVRTLRVEDFAAAWGHGSVGQY